LKNKKKDISILNTRTKSWIKPAYTLFVVAIPSFFMWFFLGKDFGFTPPLSLGYNFLVAIAFIIVIITITLFLIYFKILKMSIMTFVVPILICFMSIFLSSWLVGDNQWYRILIIVPLVFTVIPVNILVNWYETKQSLKIKIIKSLEEK
jgi:hypothetical protein